jgi:hypothetical protein
MLSLAPKVGRFSQDIRHCYRQTALDCFLFRTWYLFANLKSLIALSVFEIVWNLKDGDYLPRISTPPSHPKAQRRGRIPPL